MEILSYVIYAILYAETSPSQEKVIASLSSPQTDIFTSSVLPLSLLKKVATASLLFEESRKYSV